MGSAAKIVACDVGYQGRLGRTLDGLISEGCRVVDTVLRCQ